jgi:hypothetical protein
VGVWDDVLKKRRDIIKIAAKRSSGGIFQISNFSFLISIHIVPMEDGIQKQLVCSKPSASEIRTVKEMHDSSLAHG